MLIFVLHILVQDVMENGGIDSVEQFLESALLERYAANSILRRFVVQGRSDDSDGEETEEENSEDAVL